MCHVGRRTIPNVPRGTLLLMGSTDRLAHSEMSARLHKYFTSIP